MQMYVITTGMFSLSLVGWIRGSPPWKAVDKLEHTVKK